jgi:hypothetical protein
MNMRVINPDEFTVYGLDELDADAQQKAIEHVAAKLGDDWWDSHDIQDITDVMMYALADELGAPNLGEWGVADYPGIDGVDPDGWDLDRGSYLGLKGTLTRENAPKLPWQPGLVEVLLSTGRDYTTVDVQWDEDERDPEQERDLTVVREECKMLADAMEQAVERAMGAALAAGRKELEYKTSEEYARETIEANGYEFLEDGTMYP